MLKAGSVDVVTDNDSVRINPVEPREGRPWVIEAGIRASCEEYPVSSSGIGLNTYHLAAVIDPIEEGGNGVARIDVIDQRAVNVAQKTVVPAYNVIAADALV